MLLHHTIEGPIAAARVLLLHPVGIDLTFLAPLGALLATRYRVMRMDLRGHGQSPVHDAHGQPAGSLDEFAQDVHETLSQTGFAPCTIAGFSFGGMVAQTLALRHPGDVKALMLCACPCTLTEERRAISLARGTDALRDGMGAVIDATMARWFTPAFRNSDSTLTARQHLLEGNVLGWAQGWLAISQIDTLQHLPTLRLPALCIAGELDLSSTPDNVAQIADAIPGAQYQIVAGAPHMLFIEQPEAVAQLMLPFLDAHSAEEGTKPAVRLA